MFEDKLFDVLHPLLSSHYDEDYIKSLASHMTSLIEVNPRDGSDIPLLKDHILDYLEHPATIDHVKSEVEKRESLLAKLHNISERNTEALHTLGQLALTSSLTHDKEAIADIFRTNFAGKINWGDMIFAFRFNHDITSGYH